jgi:hypothetical protein
MAIPSLLSQYSQIIASTVEHANNLNLLISDLVENEIDAETHVSAPSVLDLAVMR